MVYPSPELEYKLKTTVTPQTISILSKKPWIESYRQTEPKRLVTSPYDDIVILCVDFPDKVAQLPVSTIYNRFFSTTLNSGYTFTNYFNEISYNKYIPVGNVYGWYRLPQNSSYYLGADNGMGTYPNNYQKLVEDALDIFRIDNIDMSIHDKDYNTILDYLFIVHSGGEAAATGLSTDFWAHVSQISPKIVNGYIYRYYASSAEYIISPILNQVSGVDCHEHAHLLGIPDLYNATSSGVGQYSLMGNGNWSGNGLTPTHIDPRGKIRAGFINPLSNVTGTVSIPSIETNNITIKYTTDNLLEYYLIENRQNIGFDINLISNGILIWHINDFYYNNNNPCYHVKLVQADGRTDIENNINSGDFGDTYPGSTYNRFLNEFTTPSTILCDGAYSVLDISNISNSSNTMTYNATNNICRIPSCILNLM